MFDEVVEFLYPSTCCVRVCIASAQCPHVAARICYRLMSLMSLMPCLIFHQANPLQCHSTFATSSFIAITFSLFIFKSIPSLSIYIVPFIWIVFGAVYKLIHSIPSWFTIKMPFTAFAYAPPTLLCTHLFYFDLIGQCNIFLLQCLHNAISCTFFSEQNPCSGADGIWICTQCL